MATVSRITSIFSISQLPTSPIQCHNAAKTMTQQAKQLLGYNLLIRIIFIMLLWIFQPLFPINKQMAENNLFYYAAHTPILNLFVPWDSQWFLSIADTGYTTTAHYAFYPLYPMLIRGIHILAPFINPILIGIIISNSASIAAAYYLDRYIAPVPMSTRYVLATLFAFNPSTIFFSSVYSESLFLFLSIFTWYSLQQKRYYHAGIALLAAGLTRSIGVVLIIPLIAALMQHRPRIKHVIYLMSMYTIGNGLFPIISIITTHNPTIYLEAQSAFLRNAPSIAQLIHSLSGFTHFFSLPYHSFQQSQLDLLWCLGVTSIIISMIKTHYSWKYIVYTGSIMLIPLMSGTTMSLIRMCAIAFPVTLYLIKISSNKPGIQYLIMITTTMMAIGTGILYCHWYWVA